MSDFLNDLKGVYKAADEKASDLKKSFGRALVDATNLQPADMRKLPLMRESQDELREYAAEAADIFLPGTTDAIPVGKIVKGSKAASKIIEKLKKVEAANLPEMTRRGYDLLKATEKPAQSLGKVIVKESTPTKIGKVILKP